jgi:hypothetical protein
MFENKVELGIAANPHIEGELELMRMVCLPLPVSICS